MHLFKQAFKSTSLPLPYLARLNVEIPMGSARIQTLDLLATPTPLGLPLKKESRYCHFAGDPLMMLFHYTAGDPLMMLLHYTAPPPDSGVGHLVSTLPLAPWAGH